jgi:hypothetical protein
MPTLTHTHVINPKRLVSFIFYEHAPPAAPLTTPPQVDSPQPLSHAAGALTGAPDRLARTLTAPPGAHSSSPASVHPSERPRELASPAQPPAHGDGGLQHAPALRESTMALTGSVGAQTGAPDRIARTLTAPPGAHSSSSAPVHQSGRPRELANPAQSPAQGDGGLQHAPVLRESTMALTGSVGPLLSSAPLHWQHEDRGRTAAESLTPVPGSYSVTGDSPPFGSCPWTGSSHALACHPASLATPGSPDPGSNARSKLPPNSS